MASDKKTKKQNIEKRAEKLGELAGVRRPYLGILFLVLGILFTAAFVNYAPGQDVFFRESVFKEFIYTTDSASANVCGRVGATLCLVAISLIGLGAILLPIYLFMLAYLCFTKRAKLIGLGRLGAMLGCVVSLTAMFTMAHMFKENGLVSSEYFPSGWGGKLGVLLYANLMHPALSFFGSFILLSCVYAFCLVASFAESPIDIVVEVYEALKGLPRNVAKLFAKFFALIGGIFKSIFTSKKSDEEADISLTNSEEIEDDAKAKPRGKRKSKSTKIEGKEDEDVSERAKESAEDFYDGDADFSIEPSSENPQTSEAEIDANVDDVADESADDKSDEVRVKSEDENREDVGNSSDIDDVAPTASVAEVLGVALSADAKKSSQTIERPLSQVGEYAENISENRESAPVQAESKEADFIDSAKSSKLKILTLEAEDYVAPKERKVKGDYIFPSVDILNKPKRLDDSVTEDYDARMAQIIATLKTFKIGVSPAEVFAGPVVTRYEVCPNEGVRINKISSLEDDLALGLKVKKVRVTITGRGTVGIEVPNLVRQNVSMREILESKAWNEAKGELPVVLGKDITGKPVILDLARMPHALIAGSTGSGKSVCINTIIASLLYRFTPDDLRMIMVDPKMVELQVYNALPHQLVPVVTDPRKVPAALAWLIKEMMRRFGLIQKMGVRNISGFNAKILKDKDEQKKAEELETIMTPEERAMSLSGSTEIDSDDLEIPEKKLPYIVCIIDELADMMMVAGKEVENSIARLSQLGRAAGIHLIVATQRPSTDVITGLIKSNLPTRIGFKTASYIDSRTILDNKGAETLIGMGDMLFITQGSPDLVRAQGAFLNDEEIENVVDSLKVNGDPEFEEDIQNELDAAGEDGDFGLDDDWEDSLSPKAFKIFKECDKASISLLQRKLRIGYPRAAKILDELEAKGYVGPSNGPSNPREILK